MWYLIVPPFIVIFGLGALLWYMAKRMEDPATIAKMSSLKDVLHTDAQSRSLNRKAFFLKLLEKNASRFKTNSLRVHNFFQHSLERLRMQRKNIDAIRKTVEDRRVEDRRQESVEPGKKNQFLSRFGAVAIKKSLSLSKSGKEKTLEQKISLQSPTRIAEASPLADIASPPFPKRRSTVGNSFALAGSMVKRSLTRPDARVAGQPPKRAEEDGLIRRISENPKDAVAYEELGDYYFTKGSMQDAKDCYRQVIKLHPTNRAVKIKIRRLEKFFENGAK